MHLGNITHLKDQPVYSGQKIEPVVPYRLILCHHHDVIEKRIHRCLQGGQLAQCVGVVTLPEQGLCLRIECLQRMAASEKFTAAICAAPKVLAHAGLLAGKQATSYPGALDADTQASLDYQETAVVQDGTVITSRGPSVTFWRVISTRPSGEISTT